MAIAVAGSLLGAKHRLIDTERSPGEIAEQREHVGGALFLRCSVHQSSHGDGAGVDHRVERAVGDLIEHDRVERLSGRLDADMLEHGFAAIAVERVAIHERLRYGLDGEGVIGVADSVDLSVDRGDGDAEQ
jgi:hypothetical protein